MRCVRRFSSVALIASFLGAAVAHADPPWSAPATVTTGIDVFWHPTLAFTGDGHALASLNGSGAGQPTRILASNPGASAFTEIGRATLVADPAPYGQRGVAYLRTSPPRARGRARVARLGVSLGTAPGSLGRVRQLARVDISQMDLTARIAADPRGNVAVAWLDPRPRLREPPRLVVRVALRRPGHAFGRATTLGDAIVYSDGGDLLDMAYGDNGDLVVAFQRTRSKAVSQRTLEIAARVERRGRGFGPMQSLGPSLGFSSIATAVAPTGAAVLAWGTQDGGEGVEEPWTVQAAVLHAGARRFSKTQLLDPGRVARPAAPVSAAIDPDGTATVAWSGVAAGELAYPVRVATARAAGRFGDTAQLAPNGAARGVVTAHDGTTTVLWGVLTDPEAEQLDRILASRRPAVAGDFAPPEAVSPPEPAVNNASIALDPRTGHPSALWIGAPGTPPDQPLNTNPPVNPLYSTRGA
jgi:hypothetical protein